MSPFGCWILGDVGFAKQSTGLALHKTSIKINTAKPEISPFFFYSTRCSISKPGAYCTVPTMPRCLGLEVRERSFASKVIGNARPSLITTTEVQGP